MGEPYEGQVAVAAVLLNRVKHPSFPNTIQGVIYQPLAFESVLSGHIWRVTNLSQANRAAQAALNGWDPTYGALYFGSLQACQSLDLDQAYCSLNGSHVFEYSWKREREMKNASLVHHVCRSHIAAGPLLGAIPNGQTGSAWPMRWKPIIKGSFTRCWNKLSSWILY